MDASAEARKILEELKRRAVEGGDGILYGDRAQALRDLDAVLVSGSVDDVRFLLTPTGNLQELAMGNGWGTEFNDLAERIEHVLGIG